LGKEGGLGQDGFVVVDKPGGMTSHDVVARIRRLARTRRVGHAGTLDPMATGVLVLGIERATRLLTYAVGHDKSYLGTIRLGESTVTDDAEGELTGTTDASHLDADTIRVALDAFRGEIAQVPSSVSAIKIKGVRSYARVRQGQDVALAARPVTISRLDVLDIRPLGASVDVAVDLTCSSGTYVRAIARDLGAALGVGGHLTALRRTAVGAFTIDEAVPLADLLAKDGPPTVLALPEVASRLFDRRDVDSEQAKVLSHGGPLPALGRSGPYAVFGPDGRVLAVVSERENTARAEVVLAPANERDGRAREPAREAGWNAISASERDGRTREPGREPGWNATSSEGK
jgi:tRNA pseudouridine55 synthase